MLPFPTTNSSQEPTLRVQINHIDHTLIHPGPLDNSSLPRVPVLRIYGPSSTGKKACVYVHQVYPYFFVEYSGRLKPRDGEHNASPTSLPDVNADNVSSKPLYC
jgi:DNA polymerase zeta